MCEPSASHLSSLFLPICVMIAASCRKIFSHEGTAKCCKMTPVICILCVLILRCRECKSPYVRKNHIIIREELFPFLSPRPSKSITGNRMLQQEAVVTLRLLVLSHLMVFASPLTGEGSAAAAAWETLQGQLSV